jgi:hypothetical protein
MLRSFRPYGIVFSTGTLPPGLQSLSNAYTLYCRAVRFHSFRKTEYLLLRQFTMTLRFRSLIGTPSSTNFILTLPAYPLAHLHMIIHGFVFEEDTKPAHEHHLQVLPSLRKPSSVPFSGTLKKLRNLT